MTKVTLDPSLVTALTATPGAVELCDVQGVSVGVFVPSTLPLSMVFTGPEISPEELARREREGGYITTAELLRRLESR